MIAAAAVELRGDAAERKARPKERPARSRKRERDEAIVCRACETELSDASAVFSMSDGRVFVNPHGIVHEVVTVRRARNVEVSGGPTTEFTWYPGYAWEIAWCAGCGAHVGWSFTAVAGGEPARFWGLRREAIVERT